MKIHFLHKKYDTKNTINEIIDFLQLNIDQKIVNEKSMFYYNNNLNMKGKKQNNKTTSILDLLKNKNNSNEQKEKKISIIFK